MEIWQKLKFHWKVCEIQINERKKKKKRNILRAEHHACLKARYNLSFKTDTEEIPDELGELLSKIQIKNEEPFWSNL